MAMVAIMDIVAFGVAEGMSVIATISDRHGQFGHIEPYKPCREGGRRHA